MKLVYKIEADKYFFLNTMTGVGKESNYNERNIVFNEGWCEFLNKHFLGITMSPVGFWADQIDTDFVRGMFTGNLEFNNGVKIKFLRK